MKIKKFLTCLLCAAMLTPVAMFGSTVGAEGTDEALVVNKTATYNEDTGDYTIELEAYATGSKIISSVSKEVPTDIVLVLDQSGSMSKNISGVGYNAYTGNDAKNSSLYTKRHNSGSNNLWHKVGDEYYSVSVTKTEVTEYIAYETGTSHNTYKNNENNLYAKYNGNFVKVSIEETNGLIWFPTAYSYKLPDGGVIATSSWSRGSWSTPTVSGTDDNLIYQLKIDDTKTTYEYTYTEDKTGPAITIGTSTGVDTVFGTTLYSKSESMTEPRLDALIKAVDNFVDSVYTKATTNNVNHRVAVVGFASDQGKYYNTELLTGVTIDTGEKYYGNKPVNNNQNTYYYPLGYAKNGVQYDGNIPEENYKSAFQAMNTKSGYENVKGAVDALTAHGGTHTDHGLNMANEIFKNNPIADSENDRKRVVIVFTDGIPTGSSSTYDETVAKDAIDAAGITKKTYGATVYTIGIFDGADATQAGSTNTNKDADKGNYVCQQISSNNGVPKSPSYYLSAGDSSTLNNIFQQISDQINEENTSTTLNAEAVVKDIIAPQFELPTGASGDDITLETWACTGKVNGEFTWRKNGEATGVTARVEGDNVNVTGFDFSGNWCGTENVNGNTTYRGNKLVIKFNVQTKPDFLGGNDVYTNTSAGVYENATATEPVLTFPRPTVNVPIGAVEVTAQDKNVYLLDSLTAEQIKSGAKVTCGGVTLDLSKADQNYGLESWQTAYVNITVTYTDASGAILTGLSELKDDTSYTVSATVEPKTLNPTSTQGTKAETKSDNKTGKINVFKPELTYQDSVVYNGDPEPTYDTTNYDSASTVWKHKVGTTETPATADIMTGTAPTLTFEYKPDSTQIKNGKINATSDKIGVEVKVEINGTDVTDMVYDFKHNCNIVEGCQFTGPYKFWLHILSTSLTIEKKFTNDTVYDTNEKFVFTVNGGGVSDLKVTVKANGSVTINNLKVGATYTVTEDTTWGWRYDSTFTVDTETKNIITLTADEEENVIVCTNTLENEKYLTGNAYADNQWKGGPGKNYVNDSSTDEVTPAPTAFSFSNRTVVNNNTAVSQNDAAAAATEAPKKKSIFSIFFGSGNKG